MYLITKTKAYKGYKQQKRQTIGVVYRFYDDELIY